MTTLIRRLFGVLPGRGSAPRAALSWLCDATCRAHAGRDRALDTALLLPRL